MAGRPWALFCAYKWHVSYTCLIPEMSLGTAMEKFV